MQGAGSLGTSCFVIIAFSGRLVGLLSGEGAVGSARLKSSSFGEPFLQITVIVLRSKLDTHLD